jgi:PhnB protein
LYAEAVEALWERAVEAGAEIVHPLAETFWGDLHGQVADPFGHRWNLARHVRDVAPDVVARVAAAAFAG